jgi:MprA protease rhombosortase-interaction domain-containing protein
MTLLSNRKTFSLLSGLAFLLVAGAAAAQSNPTSCTNDDDCIATPECGGDICDWSSTTSPMKCRPAGTSAKGMDGWCTTDDDCKCKAMGATCVTAFCTFTRPCDAPGAAGCGSGGATGTGGSGATGTGGSGATGTGGTSGGDSGDSGGCSIAATAPTAGSALLIAIGLLAFARRRRR